MLAYCPRWLRRSLVPVLATLAAGLGMACSSPAAPPVMQAAVAGNPAALAPESAPAPATALNYAATTLGWNITPTLIAQEKGFFAAQNLNVDMVIAGQSAAVCQQLLARAVEVGGCSLNDMIQTVEASGAPLSVVMQESVSVLHNGLLAQPGLTSYADLKGKTIILGGPKDNTVYFFRTMARAHGLGDNDYDMTYAGSSSARYAALKAGGAAASLLTDPFDYQIEQEGFGRLDNLRPKYISAGNYAGNGLVVRKDWAQSHQDEVVRYIRAMLGAIAWINDPAHKDELYALLAAKINLSPDTFERSYQRAVVADTEWSADGRADPAAYLGVLKSLAELGVLPEPLPDPAKYYDMTYVERVHQSAAR